MKIFFDSLMKFDDMMLVPGKLYSNLNCLLKSNGAIIHINKNIRNN